MIIFPFSFFYLFYVYSWYKVQRNDLGRAFRRNKKVYLIVSFLFSPVLTLLALPIVVNYRAANKIYEMCGCHSTIYGILKDCLKISLIFLACLPVSLPGFYLAAALGFVVLPLTGIVLMSVKGCQGNERGGNGNGKKGRV